MASGTVVVGKTIVLEARLRYRREDVDKLPDREDYAEVVPSLVFQEDELDGWKPDLSKVHISPTRSRGGFHHREPTGSGRFSLWGTATTHSTTSMVVPLRARIPLTSTFIRARETKSFCGRSLP